MAVYDLEEQDKLEDLKAWWKQWGNTLSGVVIAVCLGIVGVQGWRWWSAQQAEQASVLYAAVGAAIRANDTGKAKEAMAQLADKYGRTAYAPRGALMVAALLFDNGDKPGAKAQLAAVIDRDSEEELKDIARLRLAAILVDDKQYDEALRTLDAKHGEAFDAVYADARGDALLAAGRSADARAAYQTALGRLDAKSPYRNLVQAKLDAVGGPVPGAAATTAPAAPPSGTGSAAARAPVGAAAPPAGAAKPAAAPSTPAGAPSK